jgi:RNA polymerase sigma factor (sigma-70 family)
VTDFRVGLKAKAYNYNLETALKRATQAAGMTRVQYCSEVLGFQYTTMALYLRFKSYPKEERKLHIAVCLGVPVDHIFPEDIKGLRLEQTIDTALTLEEAKVAGVLPDPDQANPEQFVLQEDLADAVHRAMEVLAPREQLVLQMRFGMREDGREMTLEQCAREMGVTRERIRQIEGKALRRLRVNREARAALGPWDGRPEVWERDPEEIEQKGYCAICRRVHYWQHA